MDPIADFLETDYDYDYDDFKRRKKRSPAGKVELGFDPSIDLYPGDYCNLIKDLSEDRCLENSLLELWSEDNYGEKTDTVLDNLTQQDILDAVNNQTFSKTLGIKYLAEFTERSLVDGYPANRKRSLTQTLWAIENLPDYDISCLPAS